MGKMVPLALIVAALALAQPGPWEPLSSPGSESKWTGGIGLPFPAKAWVLEGGTLHLANPKRGGSLYSADRFDNFELEFEWKIAPAGNSGLKYMAVAGRIHPDFHRFVTKPLARRVSILLIGALAIAWLMAQRPWGRRPAVGLLCLAAGWIVFAGWRYRLAYQNQKHYPTGLEYQLTDDARNGDALSKPTHRCGALYDMMAPAGAELRPVDQFNDSRIVVNGQHAEHWLNGRKVVEYEFGSPALREALARSKFQADPSFAVKSAGYLELQNHGDPVWFRNMRIRRLP